MLVLASYVCLGLIAIESLVVFNIWNWPEVRSRLEGRRAAVKRHSELMEMRMMLARSRGGSGSGGAGRRRSISLSRRWTTNKGNASDADGGGAESGDNNGREELEKGWARQLMASIVRKRSSAAGGGGGFGVGGGVGGSRGGGANNGDNDGDDDEDPSFRDKKSLARGRDGADPSSGDGAATGASGSGSAGPLPLPLPPRNGAVVPRTSFAAVDPTASGTAASGASTSTRPNGGGDALFLETELEKALYHWRAWKVDVVSFYVIGSLYLIVAVLIFACSVLAARKSAREFSYAS